VTGRRVKVFTEFGAPAKIGVNDAGLGLHFNILNHAADSDAGGVPVHAIARRVLEEATTIDEAIEVVSSAPVSASTVLTVATLHDDRAGAASLELSPAGVAVVRPGDDGWLLHTNHFLDPALATGDAVTPDAFSTERFVHAHAMRTGMSALGAAERAAAFCGPQGAAAAVCVPRDESLPPERQWETLLTIALDVAGFGLEYRADTPATAAVEGLETF
jgi:isopenicillin-N N-acyltransferase like protein